MLDASAQNHAEQPGFLTRAWPFIGLGLLFLLVRVVLICLTGVMEVDSVRYISLGRMWLRGDFRGALDTAYHPLYPIVLGLFIAPFKDPELPARVLSLVLSAATMAPLGWIGWMLGGRKCSIITLAIFAILPHPWRFSIQILSEPLYLLLICGQCALIISYLKTWDWRMAVAAGLVAGGAYLTRPEGFMPLLALAPLVILPGGGAPGTLKRLITAAAVVPAFLLVAAPYMAFIGGISAKKRVTRLAGAGDYSPQDPRSAATPAPGPSPQAPPGEEARPDATPPSEPVPTANLEDPHERPPLSAWEVAGRDPDHVVREKPVKSPVYTAVLEFLKAGLFISPFFVLAGFALARVARKPWRPDLFLLILSAGNLALVLALLIAYRYVSLRHTMPATVATIPVAALGVMELWRQAGRWRPRVARGVLVLALTAFVLFFLCQGVRPLRYPKRAIKTAAISLRDRSAPGDLFLSEDPRYSFYAGRRFLGLGIMSREELEKLARERGVRFLVAERSELERRVPGFMEKVEGSAWRQVPTGVEGGGKFVPVAFELR